MKRIIKIIAWVLIAAFVAQDVAWANPEIFEKRPSESMLQIPSFFQPLDANLDKQVLEVTLKSILEYANDLLRKEGFRYHLTPTVGNVLLDLEFDKARREGENIIVPCATSSGRSARLYEAFIFPDNSIKLINRSTDRTRQPDVKEHLLKDVYITLNGNSNSISNVSQYEDLRSELAQKIGDGHKGEELLSVGIGTGVLERELCEKWEINITGIDINQQLLDKIPKSIKTMVGNGDSLSFEDRKFNIILMSESIGHLSLDKALAEASRVLNPGGTIHITTYAKSSEFLKWLGYKTYETGYLMEALAKVGFKNAQIVPVQGKHTENFIYVKASKPAQAHTYSEEQQMAIKIANALYRQNNTKLMAAISNQVRDLRDVVIGTEGRRAVDIGNRRRWKEVKERIEALMSKLGYPEWHYPFTYEAEYEFLQRVYDAFRSIKNVMNVKMRTKPFSPDMAKKKPDAKDEHENLTGSNPQGAGQIEVPLPKKWWNDSELKGGLEKWEFRQGMLFGDTDKWWLPELKSHSAPHEGLDFYSYVDLKGRSRDIKAGTKVRLIQGGRVARVIDDFIGKTIFINTGIQDPNHDGRELYVIYSHIDPEDDAVAGAVFETGQLIASVAKPESLRARAPPHLHISMAYVPKDVPQELLNWSGIKIPQVKLIDPYKEIFSGKEDLCFLEPTKKRIDKWTIGYAKEACKGNPVYTKLIKMICSIEMTVGTAKYLGFIPMLVSIAAGYPVLGTVVFVGSFFLGGILRFLFLLYYCIKYHSDPNVKIPLRLFFLTLIPFHVGFLYSLRALAFPMKNIFSLMYLWNIEYKIRYSLYRSNLEMDLTDEEMELLTKDPSLTLLRLFEDIDNYQKGHFENPDTKYRRLFRIRGAKWTPEDRAKTFKHLGQRKRLLLIDSKENIERAAREIKNEFGPDVLKRVYYYDIKQFLKDILGDRNGPCENKTYVRHLIEPGSFRKEPRDDPGSVTTIMAPEAKPESTDMAKEKPKTITAKQLKRGILINKIINEIAATGKRPTAKRITDVIAILSKSRPEIEPLTNNQVLNSLNANGIKLETRTIDNEARIAQIKKITANFSALHNGPPPLQKVADLMNEESRFKEVNYDNLYKWFEEHNILPESLGVGKVERGADVQLKRIVAAAKQLADKNKSDKILFSDIRATLKMKASAFSNCLRRLRAKGINFEDELKKSGIAIIRSQPVGRLKGFAPRKPQIGQQKKRVEYIPVPVSKPVDIEQAQIKSAPHKPTPVEVDRFKALRIEPLSGVEFLRAYNVYRAQALSEAFIGVLKYAVQVKDWQFVFTMIRRIEASTMKLSRDDGFCVDEAKETVIAATSESKPFSPDMAKSRRKNTIDIARIKDIVRVVRSIFSGLKQDVNIRILNSRLDIDTYIAEEEARAAEAGVAASPRQHLEDMFRRSVAFMSNGTFFIIPRNIEYGGGEATLEMIAAHELGEAYLEQLGLGSSIDTLKLFHQDIFNRPEPRYRWLAPNFLRDIIVNAIILDNAEARVRLLEQYIAFFDARKKYYRKNDPLVYKAYNLYLRSLEIISATEKNVFSDVDDSVESKAVSAAGTAKKILDFIYTSIHSDQGSVRATWPGEDLRSVINSFVTEIDEPVVSDVKSSEPANDFYSTTFADNDVVTITDDTQNTELAISTMANNPFMKGLMAQAIGEDNRGKKCLSIGVGSGILEESLIKDHGLQVTGIDPSQGVLGRAAERGVKTIRGQGEELPFEEKSFDIVLIMESIGHMNIDKTLAEAYKVLKPGGAIHITTYTEIDEIKKMLNYRMYGKDDITSSLNKVGFSGITDLAAKLSLKGYIYLRATKPTEPIARKNRILVNGFGIIGSKVARAARKSGFEVVISDISEEARKTALSDGFRVYTSTGDALTKETIDLIVDATPPGVGVQMKELYGDRKVIYQGGERIDVADLNFQQSVSDFAKVSHKKQIRVITCNTSAICNIFVPLLSRFNGLNINIKIENVPEHEPAAYSGMEHRVDDRHKIRFLKLLEEEGPDLRNRIDRIETSARTNPNLKQYRFHIHHATVSAPGLTADEVRKILAAQTRVALIEPYQGEYEPAREAERIHNLISPIAKDPMVVIAQVLPTGNKNEVEIVYAVPHESNVVPETLNALHALLWLFDKDDSQKVVDEILGIYKIKEKIEASSPSKQPPKNHSPPSHIDRTVPISVHPSSEAIGSGNRLPAEGQKREITDVYSRLLGPDSILTYSKVGTWENWISTTAYNPFIRDRLAQEIGEYHKGESLLSIGIGTGVIEQELKNRWGLDIKGVDIVEPLLDRARERGIDVTLADGEDLPFEDESFDTVLLSESIGHMNPDRVLSEACRVLKPGGVIHIITYRLGVKLQEEFQYKLYTLDEILASMHAQGFQDSKEVRFHGFDLGNLLYIQGIKPFQAQDQVPSPHLLATGIAERTLGGGAKLLTTLNDRTIQEALLTEGGVRIVKKEEKRVIAQLVGWGFTTTKFEDINSLLGVLEKVKELDADRHGEERPIVVMDWGCGEGTALIGLQQALKIEQINNVKLIGYSDEFYAAWQKAPEGVTFIFDIAENLCRYFKEGSINFIYSYSGLEHFADETSQEDVARHFRQLEILLHPENGEMRPGLTRYFSREELLRMKKNLALPEPEYPYCRLFPPESFIIRLVRRFIKRWTEGDFLPGSEGSLKERFYKHRPEDGAAANHSSLRDSASRQAPKGPSPASDIADKKPAQALNIKNYLFTPFVYFVIPALIATILFAFAAIQWFPMILSYPPYWLNTAIYISLGELISQTYSRLTGEPKSYDWKKMSRAFVLGIFFGVVWRFFYNSYFIFIPNSYQVWGFPVGKFFRPLVDQTAGATFSVLLTIYISAFYEKSPESENGGELVNEKLSQKMARIWKSKNKNFILIMVCCFPLFMCLQYLNLNERKDPKEMVSFISVAEMPWSVIWIVLTNFKLSNRLANREIVNRSFKILPRTIAGFGMGIFFGFFVFHIAVMHFILGIASPLHLLALPVFGLLGAIAANLKYGRDLSKKQKGDSSIFDIPGKETSAASSENVTNRDHFQVPDAGSPRFAGETGLAAEQEGAQPMLGEKNPEGYMTNVKKALANMKRTGFACDYSITPEGRLEFSVKYPDLARFSELMRRGAVTMSETMEKLKEIGFLTEGNISAIKRRLKMSVSPDRAPPKIIAMSDCPFASVKDLANNETIFDADWIRIFQRYGNDMRFRCVINWLVSERLFHELPHAESETAQTEMDIYYQLYLIGIDEELQGLIEEFFDLPEVKTSKIAKQTKARFKFLQEQAIKLYYGQGIDRMGLADFVGEFDAPIKIDNYVYSAMASPGSDKDAGPAEEILDKNGTVPILPTWPNEDMAIVVSAERILGRLSPGTKLHNLKFSKGALFMGIPPGQLSDALWKGYFYNSDMEKEGKISCLGNRPFEGYLYGEFWDEDSAIAVFKSRVFNTMLEKGFAGIAKVGKEEYRYPFVVAGIPLAEVDFILVNRDKWGKYEKLLKDENATGRDALLKKKLIESGIYDKFIVVEAFTDNNRKGKKFPLQEGVDRILGEKGIVIAEYIENNQQIGRAHTPPYPPLDEGGIGMDGEKKDVPESATPDSELPKPKGHTDATNASELLYPSSADVGEAKASTPATELSAIILKEIPPVTDKERRELSGYLGARDPSIGAVLGSGINLRFADGSSIDRPSSHKPDDKVTLEGILRKRPEEFDQKDYTAANDIAARIILAMSYEDAFTQRIASLADGKSMDKEGCFNLSEETLMLLTSLVQERAGEDAELFRQTLVIAHQFLYNYAHEGLSRQERLARYERSRIFIRAALRLSPGDSDLLKELAITLNHLGRSEEAENILKELLDGGGKRNEAVSLGYVKVEMLRQIYYEFKEALKAGRFEDALILMEDASEKAKEGAAIFSGVTGPYLRNENTNMRQLPRAFSGYSALLMNLADIYLKAEGEHNLVKVRDFCLLALNHTVDAFSNSVRALSINSNNAHSKNIYNSAVKKLEKSLNLLVSRPLDGQKTITHLILILDRLEHEFSRNNYTIPKEAAAHLKYIRQLKTDIFTRIDFHQEVEGRIVECVKKLLNDTQYTDIDKFYTDLEARVACDFPENKRKAVSEEFGSIRAHLDYDLMDLRIIESCLLLDPAERAPNAIGAYVSAGAGEAADKAAYLVGERFAAGRYKAFDFSLKSEEPVIEAGRGAAATSEEAAINPEMRGYNRADVKEFISSDESRIAKSEELYERCAPWLLSEKIEYFSGQIIGIRGRMRKFKERGENILTGDRKRLSAKEVGSELQDLKRVRSGEDGTKGYMAQMRKVEARLAASRKGIEKEIRSGRAVVRQYHSEMTALHARFGFRWLDLAGRQLNAVELNITDNVFSLSRDEFEELLAQAESVYETASFAREHIDSLNAVSELVIRVQEGVKALPPIVNADLNRQIDTAFQRIKEKYANTALSVQFEQEVESIKNELKGLSGHIEKLGSASKEVATVREAHKIMNTFFIMNQGIYLKPSAEYTDIENTLSALFDETDAQLRDLEDRVFSLADIGEYEHDVDETTKAIKAKLIEANRLTALLGRQKYILILEEIRHIENFFKKFSQWFEERIFPDFHGSPSKAAEARGKFSQMQNFIGLFKEELGRQDISPISVMDANDILVNKLLQPLSLCPSVLEMMCDEPDKILKKVRQAARALYRKGTVSDELFNPWYEASVIDTVIMRDPFGAPSGIGVMILNADGKPVTALTKKLVDSDEMQKLIAEARAEFRKWSEFYDTGEVPFFQALLILSKTLYFYLDLFEDNRSLPIVDARFAMMQAFTANFSGPEKHSQHNRSVISGFVDEATYLDAWGIIEDIYQEVNPNVPAQEWPQGMAKELENYFRPKKEREESETDVNRDQTSLPSGPITGQGADAGKTLMPLLDDLPSPGSGLLGTDSPRRPPHFKDGPGVPAATAAEDKNRTVPISPTSQLPQFSQISEKASDWLFNKREKDFIIDADSAFDLKDVVIEQRQYAMPELHNAIYPVIEISLNGKKHRIGNGYYVVITLANGKKIYWGGQHNLSYSFFFEHYREKAQELIRDGGISWKHLDTHMDFGSYMAKEFAPKDIVTWQEEVNYGTSHLTFGNWLGFLVTTGAISHLYWADSLHGYERFLRKVCIPLDRLTIAQLADSTNGGVMDLDIDIIVYYNAGMDYSDAKDRFNAMKGHLLTIADKSDVCFFINSSELDVDNAAPFHIDPRIAARLNGTLIKELAEKAATTKGVSGDVSQGDALARTNAGRMAPNGLSQKSPVQGGIRITDDPLESPDIAGRVAFFKTPVPPRSDKSVPAPVSPAAEDKRAKGSQKTKRAQKPLRSVERRLYNIVMCMIKEEAKVGSADKINTTRLKQLCKEEPEQTRAVWKSLNNKGNTAAMISPELRSIIQSIIMAGLSLSAGKGIRGPPMPSPGKSLHCIALPLMLACSVGGNGIGHIAYILGMVAAIAIPTALILREKQGLANIVVAIGSILGILFGAVYLTPANVSGYLSLALAFGAMGVFILRAFKDCGPGSSSCILPLPLLAASFGALDIKTQILPAIAAGVIGLTGLFYGVRFVWKVLRKEKQEEIITLYPAELQPIESLLGDSAGSFKPYTQIYERNDSKGRLFRAIRVYDKSDEFVLLEVKVKSNLDEFVLKRYKITREAGQEIVQFYKRPIEGYDFFVLLDNEEILTQVLNELKSNSSIWYPFIQEFWDVLPQQFRDAVKEAEHAPASASKGSDKPAPNTAKDAEEELTGLPVNQLASSEETGPAAGVDEVPRNEFASSPGNTATPVQNWEEAVTIACNAPKVNYKEVLFSSEPTLIRGGGKGGFRDAVETKTVRAKPDGGEPAWWGEAHAAIGISCKLDKSMHRMFEPGIVAVLFEIDRNTAKKYNMDAPYGLGKTWQAIPLSEMLRIWVVSVDTEEDFKNNLVRLAQISLTGVEDAGPSPSQSIIDNQGVSSFAIKESQLGASEDKSADSAAAITEETIALLLKNLIREDGSVNGDSMRGLSEIEGEELGISDNPLESSLHTTINDKKGHRHFVIDRCGNLIERYIHKKGHFKSVEFRNVKDARQKIILAPEPLDQSGNITKVYNIYVDGKNAGFVNYIILPSEIEKETWDINNIVDFAEYRGHGIAESINNIFARWAQEAGKKLVALSVRSPAEAHILTKVLTSPVTDSAQQVNDEFIARQKKKDDGTFVDTFSVIGGMPNPMYVIGDENGNFKTVYSKEKISEVWAEKEMDREKLQTTKLASPIQFLRNIVDTKELTQNMIEGILSALFSNKKVTFAFNRKLKGLESAQLRALVRQLKDWKDATGRKNPRMKALLDRFNVFEYDDLKTELDKRGIDASAKDGLIFDYTPKPKDGLTNAPGSAMRPVYIIEQGDSFPINYYYPLLEMVTISVAKELLHWDEEELRKALTFSNIDMESFGIDPVIDDDTGILIFKVLPKMERYDNNARIDRYTRLMQFLHSA